MWRRPCTTPPDALKTKTGDTWPGTIDIECKTNSSLNNYRVLAKMISVAEALTHVTDTFSPLEPEPVALGDCLGRVLADDLASATSHPPVAVSSMDGYAVRAADTPGVLKLIGESQAGGGFDGTVGTGETVRIFTGAPLPAGADAVVMQENTAAAEDGVRMQESVPEGKFIRPAGMDFSVGDVLLGAGTVLNARHIGLAAAMNAPELLVRRKPKVAVLATGDEVVMPGQPMGSSQIVSSNSFLLAAFVRALGGQPVDLGIAGDTVEHLTSAIDGAMGCDLLITIGGASVGDYDLVGTVLNELGLRQIFYKIAMRPGKPLLFGVLEGRFGELPVLGMPGNPVSAGVCSVLFLKPALAALLGIPETVSELESATLAEALPENDQRQDYLRASLNPGPDGQRLAMPLGKQDSAMLARFSEAHCLIVRPPFAPPAKIGDTVDILPLKGSCFSI